MLLQIVPISVSDTAAQISPGPLECAAGPVTALLVGRRVFVDENPFGLQIGKFLIAGIAQEQRFAAVADEYECVVRNVELAHAALVRLISMWTWNDQE